jgi:hypothetical protein
LREDRWTSRKPEKFAKVQRSDIQINETLKKGSLLTGMTTYVKLLSRRLAFGVSYGHLTKTFFSFGEPEIRSKKPSIRAKDYDPQDPVEGFFRMRLRYASKEYLQAEGLVPRT